MEWNNGLPITKIPQLVANPEQPRRNKDDIKRLTTEVLQLRPKIYRLCCSLLRGKKAYQSVAEEFTQEIIMKAITRIIINPNMIFSITPKKTEKNSII